MQTATFTSAAKPLAARPVARRSVCVQAASRPQVLPSVSGSRCNRIHAGRLIAPSEEPPPSTQLRAQQLQTQRSTMPSCQAAHESGLILNAAALARPPHFVQAAQPKPQQVVLSTLAAVAAVVFLSGPAHADVSPWLRLHSAPPRRWWARGAHWSCLHLPRPAPLAPTDCPACLRAPCFFPAAAGQDGGVRQQPHRQDLPQGQRQVSESHLLAAAAARGQGITGQCAGPRAAAAEPRSSYFEKIPLCKRRRVKRSQ